MVMAYSHNLRVQCPHPRFLRDSTDGRLVQSNTDVFFAGDTSNYIDGPKSIVISADAPPLPPHTHTYTLTHTQPRPHLPLPPRPPHRTPFIFGCVAGLAPWIVVCMYFFGSGNFSQIPSFVYGILGGYFIFFNTFPVNMALQYGRVGKWADYRVGEKTYIVLSLASKSLLTWLVFGGTFQPNGK